MRRIRCRGGKKDGDPAPHTLGSVSAVVATDPSATWVRSCRAFQLPCKVCRGTSRGDYRNLAINRATPSRRCDRENSNSKKPPERMAKTIKWEERNG
jgi:hypothetical protein